MERAGAPAAGLRSRGVDRGLGGRRGGVGTPLGRPIPAAGRAPCLPRVGIEDAGSRRAVRLPGCERQVPRRLSLGPTAGMNTHEASRRPVDRELLALLAAAGVTFIPNEPTLELGLDDGPVYPVGPIAVAPTGF